MSYIEFYAVGYPEEYEKGMLCGRGLAGRIAQLLKCNVIEVDAGYAFRYSGYGLILGKDIHPGRWFLRLEPMPLISQNEVVGMMNDIIGVLSCDPSLSGFSCSP